MPDDVIWMDKVRKKLIEIFDKDELNLIRILYYLDEEDKKYHDNPVCPYAPHWKSLRDTMHNDSLFKDYAIRVIAGAQTSENEEKFRIKMEEMEQEMPQHNEAGKEHYQDLSLRASEVFSGLSMTWSLMPVEVKEAVCDMIKQVGTAVRSSGRTVQRVMLHSSGTVAAVSLSAVQLGYKVYNHIKRWWNGEIDGSWCAKHVVDDTAALVAGGAGAAAGAACGSLIGTWGSLLGGIVGGFLAGITASALVDRLTQYLFGLPKSEALSNAYKYLGVPVTASNSEVNKAYHKLCLQHHPDKGGDTNEFFVLQVHMAVIRQARGEY